MEKIIGGTTESVLCGVAFGLIGLSTSLSWGLLAFGPAGAGLGAMALIGGLISEAVITGAGIATCNMAG